MRHTIEIRLYMSEIMYDVLRTLHALGESVIVTDANHPAASTLLQDDTQTRTDAIMRSVATAWGSARSAVSGYLVEDAHLADNILPRLTREVEDDTLTYDFAGSPSSSEGDDSGQVDNTLVLLLRVPRNARTSAKEELTARAHDAIVCSAVSDVLMTTAYADKATVYAQRATDDIAALDALLCARQRPTRVHAPAPDEPHTNDMRYE